MLRPWLPLAVVVLVVLASLPARALAASPPASPSAAPSAPPASTAAEVTELELAFDAREGKPGARLELTARLRDASGRARDAALRVEVDAGTVAPPVRVSAGVYTARLELPTRLGGRRSLLVFASAGQAVASAAVPLISGPPASLRVEAPGDLPADGANHPLWIGVADAHGNPSSEPPVITVASGTLGEAVPIGAGEWMVDYQPPRSSRERGDVVRVKAGDAFVSHALQLTPVPALLTVAPKVGLVMGAGDPTVAVAAEAGAWRPAGPAHVGLVLAAAWWGARDSGDVAMPDGLHALRSRRSWIPVTLSLASRHALGARVTATFSAGGGGAFVTSRVDLAGQPRLSESGWAPAAVASAEVALRTRFGAQFAEVRGGWLGDPGLDTIRGSAWPVMFLLGSRFDAY